VSQAHGGYQLHFQLAYVMEDEEEQEPSIAIGYAVAATDA
jgi:hypothetical protein